MLRNLLAVLGAVCTLEACAGDVDHDRDVASTSSKLIMTDHCTISGTAELPSGDVATGDVVGTDSGVTGNWFHASPSGDILLGSANFIFCHIGGATIGDVSGPASWKDQPGYTFSVHVQDHGVPLPPTPIVGLAADVTLRATRSFRPSRWEDGELAILPGGAARVQIPAEISIVGGGSATGEAEIVFLRNGTDEAIECRYRGDESRHRRHCRDDDESDGRLSFQRCTGQGHDLRAGDTVDVSSLRLHLQNGEHGCCFHEPASTVEATLSVSPITFVTPPRDFYSLVVLDPVGAITYEASGSLTGGDLNVALTPLP